MSNIPYVRARLIELAVLLHLPELAELAEMTRRVKRRERALATSVPMSPELYQEIRAYQQRHPELSSQAIAVQFGVNLGRVSEALR